ncbi:MAG: hypothetical protein SFV24_19270 [Gemmatimonadales bacterium]|nr:hypothetical protein [Gemmatimonadales bacterium]
MSAAEETVSAATSKAREVEVVTLADGRKVEFVGKRKLIKESIEVDGSPAVRLDFRNGETRTFVIGADLLTRFAQHGAEQKLGDETAGIDDVDDQVLAVDELIERLNRGEWSQKREGSGVAGTSVLLRALMEHSGRTKEQVQEFLKPKTQAEKLALRNSAKIKPIVERLEAEKASKAAKVDTDALLASL